MSSSPETAPKPKKSVALSGVVAGNTALCTVGRSGNDLHYRGYDILDFADQAEFEEVAYLLVHEKLPNRAELKAYKTKLKGLRGLPHTVRAAVEQVLALEIDIPRQIAAASQRRRPARIIGEQVVELGGEIGVLLRVEERSLELLERRDEDFRDMAAPEPAKASVQAHARTSSRDAGRSASNSASILAGDFRPGASSTAEPTSIA